MDKQNKSGSFIWYILVALIIIAVAVWGFGLMENSETNNGEEVSDNGILDEIEGGDEANSDEQAPVVDQDEAGDAMVDMDQDADANADTDMDMEVEAGAEGDVAVDPAL
ncbi:MAG: hypothetical protein ACKKL4_02890 [Patescibacteria group bacterium]